MQYVYLPNKLQHQNNKILKESKSILQHWKIHFAIPGRKVFPLPLQSHLLFVFDFHELFVNLIYELLYHGIWHFQLYPYLKLNILVWLISLLNSKRFEYSQCCKVSYIEMCNSIKYTGLKCLSSNVSMFGHTVLYHSIKCLVLVRGLTMDTFLQ